MATMSGLRLYTSFGFEITEHAQIPMPDGTSIEGASMQKAIQMTGPRMANGVAPSVVEVIGDTPTAELSLLTGGSTGRIVAKPDYLNPGFSRKDRIARQIIEDGVVSGALEPGSDEASSSEVRWNHTHH